MDNRDPNTLVSYEVTGFGVSAYADAKIAYDKACADVRAASESCSRCFYTEPGTRLVLNQAFDDACKRRDAAHVALLALSSQGRS